MRRPNIKPTDRVDGTQKGDPVAALVLLIHNWGGGNMSTNDLALVWDSGKFDFQRKLGNFVQYFQVNLPTNSYGVPLKLINPMPLAEHLLDCDTTDDMPESAVDHAITNIDFDEGIPTIDGLPMWERLDGELMDYYKLFKEYREMLYVRGSRALAKLGDQHKIEGRYLAALSKMYHWQLRCRAFDTYKRMEREAMRQREIEKLEHKHAEASALLLERGLQYLEDHPEQLNPKVAIQMVQVAMKAGRLAVGLNPDKPGIGSESSGTNISIHQSTGGSADEMSTSVEVKGGGQEPQTDTSYLQSIVHILDKSGALDKAKQKVIDADYTEVNEEAN